MQWLDHGLQFITQEERLLIAEDFNVLNKGPVD